MTPVIAAIEAGHWAKSPPVPSEKPLIKGRKAAPAPDVDMTIRCNLDDQEWPCLAIQEAQHRVRQLSHLELGRMVG